MIDRDNAPNTAAPNPVGWGDDESAALDRETRRMRASAERAVRRGMPEGHRFGSTTELTDAEARRRQKVERAMQVRADRERDKDKRSNTYRANRAKRPGRVRWPKPKQKANGRWRAAFIEQGQHYSKTFTTEAEAQAWIDQMLKEKQHG